MKKKKLTTKDKALLGVLIALIIIVIGIGAFVIVNNVNSANEQTAKITANTSAETTTSTTSSTKSSKGSKSSATASKSEVTDSTEGTKAADTTSTTSSTVSTSSKSDNKSSKTTSSKTSSKADVKGDKMKRVVPEENKKHSSSKVLKVNGTKCYVGDTISVVLNLKSQKSLINYQGTTSFDSKYLKLKDVKSNSIGVANGEESVINYNASTISGMNFSETGTVYTATFEVLAEGSTKISNNVEIISELIDNNIVQLSESDYKATVDIYN